MFSFLVDELKRSIVSIENLSNEIFYEIFDYLDGNDVYNAFADLNHRFKQLLNSSSLLFKIKFHRSMSKKQLINNWKQFILLNNQQIFSIDFSLPLHMNQCCSKFTINSTFSRLESLVLKQIHSNQVMSLFAELPCLPRLFSLTIYISDQLKDLTNIYRIMFTLPVLKYFKFTTIYAYTSISLPMAINKQCSPIEHMVIDQCCAFEELSTIISYTLQLRRLVLRSAYKIDLSYEIILPLTLSNLAYISITIYSLPFDEFKNFIRQISLKLKVLCVATVCADTSYLDADQWEEFILKDLSHLKKFSLKYNEHMDDDQVPSVHIEEPIQFNSSFWIEQQMGVGIEITYENIQYSIQPLKKRWYEDSQDKINNSSIDHSQSNRLILKNIYYKKASEFLLDHIYYVSFLSQIYHMEIPYNKISIDLLIQIVDALPQLISLKIHSLSMNKPRKLSSEEIDILSSIKNTSKIKHVYFEKMIKVEAIDFLMTLCPYMVYLKLNYLNDVNVQYCLRHILKKINNEFNEHLRLLCFHIRLVNDKIVAKLEKMIHSEKLLVDYTITCVFDKIYLEWI